MKDNSGKSPAPTPTKTEPRQQEMTPQELTRHRRQMMSRLEEIAKEEPELADFCLWGMSFLQKELDEAQDKD